MATAISSPCPSRGGCVSVALVFGINNALVSYRRDLSIFELKRCGVIDLARDRIAGAFAGGDDPSARVWDIGGDQGVETLPTAFAASVRFAPGDRTLAVGHWDGSVSLWDSTKWERKTTLRGEGQ